MYFVYWKDADTGEIVGTYTTYSFFQTKETAKFIPVYATQENYYSERNKATIASRIVDCRKNDNDTYSLLAEHSVASSCKTILSHGVVYTTDSAYVDSLERGNANVSTMTARKTMTSLTGLYEVCIDLQEQARFGQERLLLMPMEILTTAM